jgi:hypothetical protein
MVHCKYSQTRLFIFCEPLNRKLKNRAKRRTYEKLATRLQEPNTSKGSWAAMGLVRLENPLHFRSQELSTLCSSNGNAFRLHIILAQRKAMFIYIRNIRRLTRTAGEI